MSNPRLSHFDRLSRHPNRIFFIDGMGALLTAGLLALIASDSEAHFGLPQQAIQLLAGMALIFAVYSFTCALFAGASWRRFLKIIAVANLSYCALTLSLLLVYLNQTTSFDLIYFLGEIGVILFLAVAELRLAHLS